MKNLLIILYCYRSGGEDNCQKLRGLINVDGTFRRGILWYWQSSLVETDLSFEENDNFKEMIHDRMTLGLTNKIK